MPAPPENLEFAWAHLREHLQDMDPGEAAHRIINSRRYQRTVAVHCARVDRETAKPQKRSYSTAELESFNLIRRLTGKGSDRATRDWLASDRGRTARRLLGFDRARIDYGAKKRRLLEGVPSESTMTRHNKRFPEAEREAAWREFFEASREANLRALSGSDELRFVAFDGTAIRIHYTAPVVKKKTGEITNADSVTAPEAGFKAASAPGDVEQSGDGFSAFTALMAGLPMIYDVTRINADERMTAQEMFEREWNVIKPYLGQDGKLPIFDADAGLHSQPLRALIHRLGGIPRIHHRSHNDSKKTKRAVAKDRRTIWEIDGYPKWRANSLRQIFCVCGEGRTFRRFDRTRQGHAVARTEGACKNCGPVSVTAGEWRPSKNPRKFIKCVHPIDYENADWSFGNPLWYDDPLAKEYGKKRFGAIEGFHGTLESRFGVNRGKRWIRRRMQARLDVTMVYAIIHELAIQQRHLAASNGHATGPP